MLLLLTIKYKLEYVDVLSAFENHKNYSGNNHDNRSIEFAVAGHVAANNLQQELERALDELRIEKYKFTKEW